MILVYLLIGLGVCLLPLNNHIAICLILGILEPHLVIIYLIVIYAFSDF